MTIKKALIDLSGTLHIEDYAIPGAVEALKKYNVNNYLRTTQLDCELIKISSPDFETPK